MKKLILAIALLMLTVVSYGQYNKWAVSGEYGNQWVDDKTAVSVDNFDHFGLGIRYNVNDIVGIGVTGGYDKTTLSEDDGISTYDFEYKRANVEGYINTFKWLDLYSKRFTVLLHAGTGMSIMNGGGFEQTVFNVRGGGTLLFKISNGIALNADFTTTSNINQLMKLDGSGPSVNTAANSLVSNASVGLTFYLGKKKQAHADWYVRPDDVPFVNTTVVNNVCTVTQYDTTKIIDIWKSYYLSQPHIEYVFFDHDKYDIKNTELNAIYKVYTALANNSEWKLIIKGFASPTTSSAEYNKILSEKRSTELLTKFVDMGIDKSRIQFEAYGKDTLRSKENVHDIARRVELIIEKNKK